MAHPDASRLVLLGTKGGPALRPAGPRPTASLLELPSRRIVVDCGLGVTIGLADAGVDLRTLDTVFVTHLHADHLLELGPLLHTAWTTGRRQPVTVYGPPGIETYLAGFLASMAFDIATRVEDEGRSPLDGLLRVRTLTEGVVLDEEGLRVSALRVPHPPVDDCFALRFDAERSITFSADTAYHPPLAAFARASAVLVHEAMLPDGIEALIRATGLGDRLRAHLVRSHSTVEEAARIAAAAQVEHLVLHHLIPADDPGVTAGDWLDRAGRIWPGRVTVGRDGLSVPW